MRRTMGSIGSVLAAGLLLVILLGVLVAYLVVTSDLSGLVYTDAQAEFLDYNMLRSVSQVAPTWNIVLPAAGAESAAPLAILPVQASQVWARLIARYEEQGGVSVTVYDLDFRGEYTLLYSGPETSTIVSLFFPFPGNLETLHGVRFVVDGVEPVDAQFSTQGISWQTALQAGEEHHVYVGYEADGANSFTYGLHHDRRTDVDVTIEVVGLTGSEVPRSALTASGSEGIEGGEAFVWDYRGLIANRDIRLNLPARLSFAQRVAALQDDFELLAGLAPVLVGLFLAALAGLFRLNGMRLSLVTYLLVGCGVVLFYPLLTFLSGLVNVTLAAVIALVVVSGLLLAFLGLMVGWRQTWWRAGVLLVVFLGLFSLGLLTSWRGLLLTSGGVLLVGTFMGVYARRPQLPDPQVEVTAPHAEESDEAPDQAEPVPATEAVLDPAHRHCPHCGRELAEDHSFCPKCGQDVQPFIRCPDCSYEQFVPQALRPVHCVHCGRALG
jgi:hypothetical protein